MAPPQLSLGVDAGGRRLIVVRGALPSESELFTAGTSVTGLWIMAAGSRSASLTGAGGTDPDSPRDELIT